jgi:hypothetical protein
MFGDEHSPEAESPDKTQKKLSLLDDYINEVFNESGSDLSSSRSVKSLSPYK